MYYAIKILLTALIVVAVSEIAKRSSLFAAIIVSLPLTSILAFCWLYYDTRSAEKIISLSNEITWLIIPSILFFIALPIALKYGIKFVPALAISSAVMLTGYALSIYIKKLFG